MVNIISIGRNELNVANFQAYVRSYATLDVNEYKDVIICNVRANNSDHCEALMIVIPFKSDASGKANLNQCYLCFRTKYAGFSLWACSDGVSFKGPLA